MKVHHMTNSLGNKVANQFIITQIQNGAKVQYFQSYDTIIVCRKWSGGGGNPATCSTHLDRDKWNYSVTTSRYRNQFLGETTKETQKKIDSGEYILANLN